LSSLGGSTPPPKDSLLITVDQYATDLHGDRRQKWIAIDCRFRTIRQIDCSDWDEFADYYDYSDPNRPDPPFFSLFAPRRPTMKTRLSTWLLIGCVIHSGVAGCTLRRSAEATKEMASSDRGASRDVEDADPSANRGEPNRFTLQGGSSAAGNIASIRDDERLAPFATGGDSSLRPASWQIDASSLFSGPNNDAEPSTSVRNILRDDGDSTNDSASEGHNDPRPMSHRPARSLHLRSQQELLNSTGNTIPVTQTDAGTTGAESTGAPQVATYTQPIPNQPTAVGAAQDSVCRPPFPGVLGVSPNPKRERGKCTSNRLNLHVSGVLKELPHRLKHL